MAKAADRGARHLRKPVLHRHRAEAPLPPEYAILGRVVGGDKTVRRIARLATDPATEMPLDPVVIKSIKIERR